MSGFNALFLVLFGTAVLLAAAGTILTVYRKHIRKLKGIERGLKMVPLLIHLPPPSDDTQSENRDVREVMREKLAQAETLYGLLAGTYKQGAKGRFFGQRHVAFEIIATEGLVHFYVAVPVVLVATVEQAVVTAYPGARVERAEDHNIFNQEGKLPGTLGGTMELKNSSSYPIATYGQLEKDPLSALMNTLSGLKPHEGAGVQFLIRPAGNSWVQIALRLVKRRRKKKGSYKPVDLLKAPMKVPDLNEKKDLTTLEQQVLDAIEEKTKHPAFEAMIRVVVSSLSYARSEQLLQGVATTFALYEAPGLNGFKLSPTANTQQFVTDFIFRFFPAEQHRNILNTQELATLLHLPDSQFTATSGVQRQFSKQVDGPATLPADGLLMGYNMFRGVQKEIRLSLIDRRRHTYVVGQTGTGKSTMLENLAVQDMLAGQGFAFIDPHGDTAERLISMVPKQRAEDVIYFNPADVQNPLGLNIFEFSSPEEKDFLIQEAINMLYKLYDPGHTGIIGPRYEHWFRNAALTLMSDPSGATFIEIPKVFTDNNYLKQKFKYVTDPTVIDFWTKEMAQTSDYHKSEMLGWFVSKFGAFMSNEIMRNIIGQPKSAFNLRDVMDKKKILIVNLSKGQIGELNSQLLGIMFVIKFQAAAMSRAAMAEAERSDFCLYVDEFQNFSTDSFASILSEARKYRLNLIVANQYIGQLTEQIRDAVFGNVGTVASYRCSPDDAEYLERQFAPVFEARDLVNLPNFNTVIRLLVNDQPSQPFSMTALPPLGVSSQQMGTAVKQLSAAKYGRKKAAVDAEIINRMQGVTAVPPTQAAPIQPVPTPEPLASAVPPPAPVAAAGPVPPPTVAPPSLTPTLMPASPTQPPTPVVSSKLMPPVASAPTSMPVATPPVPVANPVTTNLASPPAPTAPPSPLPTAQPELPAGAVVEPSKTPDTLNRAPTIQPTERLFGDQALPAPAHADVALEDIPAFAPGMEVRPQPQARAVVAPAEIPEAQHEIDQIVQTLAPDEVYVDTSGKVYQPKST